MIITCPSCKTEYSVSNGVVDGITNPRFHCAMCNHYFELTEQHQAPSQETGAHEHVQQPNKERALPVSIDDTPTIETASARPKTPPTLHKEDGHFHPRFALKRVASRLLNHHKEAQKARHQAEVPIKEEIAQNTTPTSAQSRGNWELGGSKNNTSNTGTWITDKAAFLAENSAAQPNIPTSAEANSPEIANTGSWLDAKPSTATQQPSAHSGTTGTSWRDRLGTVADWPSQSSSAPKHSSTQENPVTASSGTWNWGNAELKPQFTPQPQQQEEKIVQESQSAPVVSFPRIAPSRQTEKKPKSRRFAFRSNSKILGQKTNKQRSWQLPKLSLPHFSLPSIKIHLTRQTAFFLCVPLLFVGAIIYWSANLDSTPQGVSTVLGISSSDAPQVPPVELELVNVASKPVTLDDGKKVVVVSGRIINTSSSAFYDIKIEASLFDKNNRTIQTTTVPLYNGLSGPAKINTLKIEAINNLQLKEAMKDKDLRPGQSTDFKVVFTSNIETSAYFSARVFSVRPKKD